MLRLIQRWFPVPTGGVGIVTVTHYPKSFDYAVVACLIIIAALVTWLVSTRWRTAALRGPDSRVRLSSIFAIVIFIVMFFVHDNPYVIMDPFHEGEHLTPAFLFRQGARPYGDVFILHGLAYDGGVDSLVLGDPQSLKRTRRMETILDAATLALLAPIAGEVSATATGAAAAVIVALCAVGSGLVPVFPYNRFAPIFVAALALLYFMRTGRGLFIAFAASTLGILWSLDTGLYALAATAVCTAILRPPLRRVAFYALTAIALPVVVLLAVRADLRRFAVDSFVIIPRSIDAIWSLPARTTFDWETARYYFPPIFFGWLLAVGVRRRDWRAVVIAIFSIIAFRSAAGRCSWSHTRYGTPLFGVALVAFALEPLIIRKRWILTIVAAIPIIVLAEVGPNAVAGARFIAGWRARQSDRGFMTPQQAADIAALTHFVSANAAPGAPILDVVNERALYYLLERRPPTRCFDIPLLSSPPLLGEAMQQLQRNPPAVVVVEGMKEIGILDGLTNRDRVPLLFDWIDRNYPRRTRVGRFVVATK